MKYNLNESGLAGLLFKNSPWRVGLSIFLSLLAGLAHITLVPLLVGGVRFEVVNADSNDNKVGDVLNLLGVESASGVAIIFAVMCTVALAGRIFSGRLMLDAVMQLVVDLKHYLYKKIAQAPVRDVEKVGFSSLIATLTEDVDKLTEGARMMPVAFNYWIMLFGATLVLSYMSIYVAIFSLIMGAIGMVAYKPFAHYGGLAMYRARLVINRIFEFKRGLIYGAKELKLNADRRSAFINDLHSADKEYKKHRFKGGTLFMAGAQYTILMVLLTLGAIAFSVSSYLDLSIESTLIVVMTLIFIIEPILGIAETNATIYPARISKDAIQKVLDQLGSEKGLDIDEEVVDKLAVDSIRVVDLEHRFSSEDEDEDGFHVGPASFELTKGQTTFITGGNGSGKSTLGKMLSLHYLPTGGELVINGTVVDDGNRESFRQAFSAIYTDYYLFSKLYNVNENVRNKVQDYLKRLHLDKKVTIKDDELPTSGLSDGQRKRLALLATFVEDRDVYLFDEWAADQDPQFKDVFYNGILNQLKLNGKIVIVITHDDRYFHLADQLVKMENGSILSINNEESEWPSCVDETSAEALSV